MITRATLGSQVPRIKKFVYLTFDCYGTLIDWRKGIEMNLKKLLGGGLKISGSELLGLYTTLEAEEERRYRKYSSVLADTAKRLANRLRTEISERQASEFADSLPSWPAFDDTVSQLRELGRLGYKRYILSNVDEDLLAATIGQNGLEIDGFVTAEEVRSYKPAENHWLAFMKRTGASRENLLHVAQSVYHDIVPTSRLGIANAWINRYRESLTGGATPTFTCSNLIELRRLLLGMSRGS